MIFSLKQKRVFPVEAVKFFSRLFELTEFCLREAAASIYLDKRINAQLNIAELKDFNSFGTMFIRGEKDTVFRTKFFDASFKLLHGLEPQTLPTFVVSMKSLINVWLCNPRSLWYSLKV